MKFPMAGAEKAAPVFLLLSVGIVVEKGASCAPFFFPDYQSYAG
jgi:hypothetical protein